jgi:hypothetical protein
MRKFALLAAAAVAGLASASVSRADFVYQTTVSPEPATVTSQGTPGVANPFFGDDIVLLQMKSVTGAGVQSNYALSWSISASSIASSPQFFIRTWDAALGTWDQGDAATPGTDADLANQGSADSNGATVNPRGSYIRIGGTSGFNVVPAASSDQTGTYTDLQSLPGFTMTEFSSSQPAGHFGTLISSTVFQTIGEAIVPHGQEVTFSGNVISDLSTDLNGVAFSVSANTPEPTSFAVIGIGAAGLLARRRRA